MSIDNVQLFMWEETAKMIFPDARIIMIPSPKRVTFKVIGRDGTDKTIEFDRAELEKMSGGEFGSRLRQ
jgi:hypothetical protein